jgi:hypothetical protein
MKEKKRHFIRSYLDRLFHYADTQGRSFFTLPEKRDGKAHDDRFLKIGGRGDRRERWVFR